jgi:hypothetical protein
VTDDRPTSPASGPSISFLEADADQAQVAAYATLMEAELARGRLESEGIAARVVDGHTVAIAAPLSIALGGVKLWVSRDDLEAARAVLFAPAVESSADDASATDAAPRATAEANGSVAQRALHVGVIATIAAVALAVAAMIR